jgi:hypothetical protein
MSDHSRTNRRVLVGKPVTVRERLVPWDCEYRFPSPSTVDTHSQYWVTATPALQVNVTVDDVSVDPGAGVWICARANAGDVAVGVAVRVPVAVGDNVGVRLGTVVEVGLDVGAPGPYW